MSWTDWEAQVPGGLEEGGGLPRDCARGGGWRREACKDVQVWASGLDPGHGAVRWVTFWTSRARLPRWRETSFLAVACKALRSGPAVA